MYRFFLSALLFFFISQNVQAQQNKIPEELQEWIPWVVYEQEEKTCTIDGKDSRKRYCTWPSALELNVDHKGATFKQEYLVETKSLVPLPGTAPAWPVSVKANGKDLILSNVNGHPAVWLNKGQHTVTGHFTWNSLPENLFIPPATGLIKLTMHGKKVQTLQLDKQGRLWFKQKQNGVKDAEESLSLQVFRKIEDGVPLLQQMRIHLTVSGAARQVTLGLKIGSDLIPLALHSPLPIRFDKQNRLQLQVRPGQWEIRITLRNNQAQTPEAMAMGAVDGPWPEQEIWVFAADQKLRQITIKGVPAVDPSRTTLPENWKKLPSYLMKRNSEMRLFETNRGNPSPVPNRLHIKRKIWLDEQGNGLTVLDTITGTMTRDWRLNVDAGQNLGRAEVEGRARLITTLKASGQTGVEVRKGKLALLAESRIDKGVTMGRLVIPAIGWNHHVQSLSTELNLPPGWKLFSASGVDKVSTWLTRWTLLDIFLVLIIALATGKILGWGWGAVAICTLVLGFHQPGSPRYLWLPLLGILGLRTMMASATAEKITKLGALLILLVLIISSIPYMISEIRTGIFPQLEYGSHRSIVREKPMPQASMDASQEIYAETEGMAEDAVRSGRVAKTAKISRQYMSSRPAPMEPKKIQIDPEEMIQTGPGLPNWSWKRIALRWNGPVKPEQNISFLLLSPLASTILAFVRVLLLALFLAGFLLRCLAPAQQKKSKQSSSKSATTAALFLLFFLGCGFFPQNSHAEVPPSEILQELHDRLLKAPKCADNCIAINACNIIIKADTLQITLQIDAQVQSAVTLPGKDRFFDQITRNGKIPESIRVNDQGFTTMRLSAGSHTVSLLKDIKEDNKLSLSFPTLPASTQTSLQGWDIIGLRADGLLSPQISLKRIQSIAKTASENKTEKTEIEIPVFVQVERILHMDLKWTVSTRIIRKSKGTVIALNIPLLPGEHVTSDGVHVINKQARITMGPEQQVLRYHSSLESVDKLTLTAADTTSWHEVWFLDVSPIWHVETKGLPEINQTNPAGKRYPEFHPYPGEALQLMISKPDGVPGPTMTISKSKLLVKPGHRTTATSLRFSLTASRGMQHSIQLPKGIDLQKSLINNKEIPLQLVQDRLTLPIHPGQQDVEISWRSEGKLSSKTETERVDLGVESVNSSIEMQVPSSRWILFAGGPRVGPAVLFWGELLVLILVAIGLGRTSLTPLSTLQWLLLSIGLSQIPVALAAIVVGWLLLLGVRKKQGNEIKHIVGFNLFQVLLVFLTLLALATLFFAIQQGLLGHPDMQIGGNGSNGRFLHWYQDRADSMLPTAWVVTVPMLVYRITMLLWALWLAMALLNWLRWGWNCFSSGSSWKFGPVRKKTPQKANKKNSN